jgi:hypothetical protein
MKTPCRQSLIHNLRKRSRAVVRKGRAAPSALATSFDRTGVVSAMRCFDSDRNGPYLIRRNLGV